VRLWRESDATIADGTDVFDAFQSPVYNGGGIRRMETGERWPKVFDLAAFDGPFVASPRQTCNCRPRDFK